MQPGTTSLKVAKADGEIHLYTNGATPLYIHAEVIISRCRMARLLRRHYAGIDKPGCGLDELQPRAQVNFNTSTGDEAALNSLNNTFNDDWSRTQNVTVWNSSAQPLPPTTALKDRVPTAGTAFPQLRTHLRRRGVDRWPRPLRQRSSSHPTRFGV